MDIRNCKKCTRLFSYTGNPLCPACAKELEDKFTIVRQFIYDNPNANMTIVSEETEVPIQQIKRWVKEERLSFTKDSGVVLSCENCGKSILTGRYCKECKNTMRDSLSGLYVAQSPAKKKEGDPSARMRFLKN